jgi:hypothetical protein
MHRDLEQIALKMGLLNPTCDPAGRRSEKAACDPIGPPCDLAGGPCDLLHHTCDPGDLHDNLVGIC